jgi:hypothetical protein
VLGSLAVAGQVSSPANSTLVMDFVSGADQGRLLAKNSAGTYTNPIMVVNPLTTSGNLTVSGTGTSSFAGNVTVTGTGASYSALDTGSFVKIGNNQTGANLQLGSQSGAGAILQGAATGVGAFALLAQPYGGNFLIGTVIDGGQKLQVAGVANSSGAGYTNSGFQITNTTASRTVGLFLSNAGVTTIRDVTGAADLFTISLLGAATFGGTAIFGKAGANTTFSANGTTAESGIYTQANTGFVFFADNASATKGIKVDVNNGGLTVLSGGLTTATAGGSAGTWKLGVYSATAPSATGYVTIDIGGTTYKLLAST